MMASETYFFYDKNSDNNRRFKKLLKLLNSAVELEKKNNPEVFEHTEDFHCTAKRNDIMEQLTKDFSESTSNFPSWAYAVFLVGESAFNDSLSYERKGHTEYLSEIRSEYHSIRFDNKVIASILLCKRPWIIYDRIKHVLDKIGFYC